ncbi:UNVERIFIED_CONTAM: hypothetical protein Sradi_4418300 [Sesamum radiatum]|uniref:Uncharacterized protein n=1 Tax=Sesamum radiatum TaxID=300843 RepID=A0AAW2NPQ6_SESRA
MESSVSTVPDASVSTGTGNSRIQMVHHPAKVEQIEASQLIQFLTGLNESYDSIRNQILMLDPFPHVNKAYSMILRVERQRQVNLELVEPSENTTLLGKVYEHKGHNKDTCSKFHGVPNWYKELTDQRKRNGGGGRAYMTNEGNYVDMPVTIEATGTDLVADLMEALKHKNKAPQDPIRVHFAQEMK